MTEAYPGKSYLQGTQQRPAHHNPAKGQVGLESGVKASIRSRQGTLALLLVSAGSAVNGRFAAQLEAVLLG